MLAELYKLAYKLDKMGMYDESNEIQEIMINMAKRVGFSPEDMITLADHFDSEGNVELANYFDDLLKAAKSKYKTWKGKDEKPPVGAEHKAPKEWWDEQAESVKKKNPDYSKKRVSEIVGDIWDNQLSDSKREKIYKRYGKTKNPNK